jgi:hypothetical protein
VAPEIIHQVFEAFLYDILTGRAGAVEEVDGDEPPRFVAVPHAGDPREFTTVVVRGVVVLIVEFVNAPGRDVIQA